MFDHFAAQTPRSAPSIEGETPRSTPRFVEEPLSQKRQPANNVNAINHITSMYRVKLCELASLTDDLTRELSTSSGKPTQLGRNVLDEANQMLVMSPRVTFPKGSAPRSKALAPMRNHSADGADLEYLIGEWEDRWKVAEEYISEASNGHNEVSFKCAVELDEPHADTSSEEWAAVTSPGAVRKRLSKLYTAEFKVKDEWNSDTNADGLQADLAARSLLNARYLAAQTRSMSMESSLPMSGDHSYSSVQSESHMFKRRFVSSPASPSRISWELCGIVLILYDMIDIPLVISFTIESNTFTDTMDWILRLFWSFNIPVVLTTGFISNGVLVMNMRSICINYCKTWLTVDVITVIPDWLLWFLNVLEGSTEDNEQGSTSLVRLLRFLRLLRVARLMRMTKLRDAWYMIYDTIDSEKVGIFLEVMKNVFILALINHYIACLWFAVGSAQTGASWLKTHGFTTDTSPWVNQFLAAYHWSLTQFASSVDVYPQSPSERAFAIAVVIFGMIGFSYLVGSIASSLARLRALNERRATNFWILRKFLAQKNVPRELCVRIRCYVESQWERQETQMSTSSIESLSLLSENLKSDLACAINGPYLAIHPLFNDLHAHLQNTTRRLMHIGISHASLAPQDMMFTAGEDATHMSILTTGTMQYERMHLEHSYPEVVESEEDWIAEPVLWISGWCHLGDLKSKTSCELLLVDPQKLIVIARLNPLAFTMLSTYSRDYTQWLNLIDKEYLSDITQGENVSKELEDIVEKISERFNLTVRKSRYVDKDASSQQARSSRKSAGSSAINSWISGLTNLGNAGRSSKRSSSS